MNNFVNAKNTKYSIPIDKSIECDGGKVLIERLIDLFKVKNRLQLADVIGVTQGTLSTWTTRNTTPYELLMRIHLATGIPMEYLCFGTGKSYTPEGDGVTKTINPTIQTEAAEALSMPILGLFVIENGKLVKQGNHRVDQSAFSLFSIEPNGNDFVLKTPIGLCFINTRETSVTKGEYLFSINGNYQIGELRQLPDGHVYFFDGEDRFPINFDTTHIHGKVVSVLKKL